MSLREGDCCAWECQLGLSTSQRKRGYRLCCEEGICSSYESREAREGLIGKTYLMLLQLSFWIYLQGFDGEATISEVSRRKVKTVVAQAVASYAL